jgi:hypothetical protein
MPDSLVMREPAILPRVWLVGLFIFVAILLSACAGTLFKVKTAVEAPLPDSVKRVESGGLSVRADALLLDEQSQELFGANLPLNGILPVRLEMSNSGASPIILEKARFQLTDGRGERWAFLTAGATASRIMKANEIYLYNPASRRAFFDAIAAHTMETKTVLGPNESRQGFVFFQAPRKNPVENPGDLLLSIQKLPVAVEIRLN